MTTVADEPRTPAPAAAKLHSAWLGRANAYIASSSFLVTILIAAAAVRFAHLAALSDTLWFDHLDLDPRYFDLWGQRIAAGDVVGHGAFFVDPLYPYFLGAVYAVFGHDLLVVRIVQILVDVATVALVAKIGAAVATRAVGNVAALLYALYAPAVMSTGEIEKTTLSTFLLTLTVFLVLREGSLPLASAGVSLALAGLTRGNILLLVIPLAIYIVATHRERAGRVLGVFLAGFAAVLGLVIARNVAVAGEFTVVASVGQNLYIGNNPLNTSGGYGQLPFVRPTPRFEEIDFRKEAEAATGHDMSSSEISAYWAGEAFDYARSEPWSELDLLTRKGALLVNDYEVPDNQSLYFLDDYSSALRWSAVSFGWLLPFALIGVIASFRSRRARLLTTILAVYSLSLVAFFILGRFRMPIVPLLAVLAAIGMRWMILAAARRELKRAVAAAVVVVCAGVLTFRPLAFYDAGDDEGFAWHNLAVLQAEEDDLDGASASMGKALELLPDNEYVLSAAGELYAATGQLAAAESIYQTLTTLAPSVRAYWRDLGDVRLAQGDDDGAAAAYQHAAETGPRRAP